MNPIIRVLRKIKLELILWLYKKTDTNMLKHNICDKNSDDFA